MSLSYDTMYDITAGIHIAFTGSRNVRLLKVAHKKQTRDKVSAYFPISTFDCWTKENFILLNLYINFVKSPSSLTSAIQMLSGIDEKEVWKFKNEIIYYNKHLSTDIDRISIEEGNNPGLDYMIEQYRASKIKWYTFYFYLVISEVDIEKLSRTRLNGFLIRKIKRLLLYVTFSEESMSKIKNLMKNTIEI